MGDSRRITPDELKAMKDAFFSIETWECLEGGILKGSKDGFIFWLAEEPNGKHIGSAMYINDDTKQCLNFGDLSPKLAKSLYCHAVTKVSRNN